MGGFGALAGCLDAPDGTPGRGGTNVGDSTGSDAPVTGDVELPVPESQLQRGAPKDGIPAITEPTFGDDWSGIEIIIPDSNLGSYETAPRLSPEDRVISVERGGQARAYPLRALAWHEVVNESFGGPLLVTYCPLCGSGLVAERRVDGEVTTFGVSGFLWQSDLVMYDEATESLWSQLMATAIRGPKTGSTLDLVPSTFTTWKGFQERHPNGQVLLPSPESKTIRGEVIVNYTRDPYRGYDESERIGIGANEFDDDRLHPKAQVLGVSADGEARAYPLSVVSDQGVVNDRVGNLPVVVAVAPDGTLVAYDRRIGATTLEFVSGNNGRLRAGGSRWVIATGEAVDGPYGGQTLDPATDTSPMFWFAWAEFNPDTDVYGDG